MIVPANFLSAEALSGLIEEFVTRDGTDYGETEVSVVERVEQVRRQIEKGEALILFDAASETTTIIPAADLSKIQAQIPPSD
ncbi:MAG TPA: YheU family protein [Marinobacterium sp.]|nr:YheU family protein [Marinobacterium sp.]